MGLFSKMHPVATHQPCKMLIHPYTDSCTLAALDMVQASAVGSAKFFAIIYLLNLLLRASKGREKVAAFFKIKTIKDYLRSVSYGITTSTIFVAGNCVGRWLLGRYSDINLCFLSSFAAGSAILLETERKHLVIASYGNMAMEAFLRRLEEIKVLRWSKNRQTLIFMFVNSVLMYLTKYYSSEIRSFWFFTPGGEEKMNAEISKEDWFISLGVKVSQYFAVGMALQTTRLLFSNFQLFFSPFQLLRRLFQFRNSLLGLFLGFNVATYLVVEKYLDENDIQIFVNHAIIAGFVAGLTFRLQPSLTILSSAMINVIQMTIDILQKRNLIPKFPYEPVLFCFYNGFLYHMRVVNATALPRTFIRIMSLVTSKRSDYIYGYYAKVAGLT